MEITEFVIQFAANERTIRSLAANIPYAQSVWKPSPREWSIVEVINHLYDDSRKVVVNHFQIRILVEEGIDIIISCSTIPARHGRSSNPRNGASNGSTTSGTWKNR